PEHRRPRDGAGRDVDAHDAGPAAADPVRHPRELDLRAELRPRDGPGARRLDLWSQPPGRTVEHGDGDRRRRGRRRGPRGEGPPLGAQCITCDSGGGPRMRVTVSRTRSRSTGLLTYPLAP